MIFYTTTIEATKENEDIVESIKEYFDIDYEIKKVVFAPAFPDGYGLDLYDKDGVKHSEFEDRHEDSEIYAFFREQKIDTPKYQNVFISEIVLEIVVMVVVLRKRKVVHR